MPPDVSANIAAEAHGGQMDQHGSPTAAMCNVRNGPLVAGLGLTGSYLPTCTAPSVKPVPSNGGGHSLSTLLRVRRSVSGPTSQLNPRSDIPPKHRRDDQDEESDDPIDMLSPRFENSNPSPELPADPSPRLEKCQHTCANKDSKGTGQLPQPSNSPNVDSLLDSFNQLTLSKPRPQGRKWPASLTPTQTQIVNQALQPNGKQVDLPGAYCEPRDLARLAPNRWLNDEVINFYGVMINLRSTRNAQSNSDKPKFLNVHCFSSFFMTKYDAGGFDSVKRWTKKIDIFAKDMILFPVNLNNLHWVLAVINIRQKRFEFYDSLGSHSAQTLRKLRTYYEAEYQAKKNGQVDLSDWSDYAHPVRTPLERPSLPLKIK